MARRLPARYAGSACQGSEKSMPSRSRYQRGVKPRLTRRNPSVPSTGSRVAGAPSGMWLRRPMTGSGHAAAPRRSGFGAHGVPIR